VRTSQRGPVRWGRVIGLAFALEVALFAALVPLQPLLSLHVWFAAIAVGVALFGYVAGRLAARGVTSGAVLNGLLVGVLATIIYLVLCALGPGGIPAAVAVYGAPLYILLNGLRIVACTAGALHQTRSSTGAGSTG
jgi:hypothetical protein